MIHEDTAKLSLLYESHAPSQCFDAWLINTYLLHGAEWLINTEINNIKIPETKQS